MVNASVENLTHCFKSLLFIIILNKARCRNAFQFERLKLSRVGRQFWGKQRDVERRFFPSLSFSSFSSSPFFNIH